MDQTEVLIIGCRHRRRRPQHCGWRATRAGRSPSSRGRIGSRRSRTRVTPRAGSSDAARMTTASDSLTANILAGRRRRPPASPDCRAVCWQKKGPIAHRTRSSLARPAYRLRLRDARRGDLLWGAGGGALSTGASCTSVTARARPSSTGLDFAALAPLSQRQPSRPDATAADLITVPASLARPIGRLPPGGLLTAPTYTTASEHVVHRYAWLLQDGVGQRRTGAYLPQHDQSQWVHAATGWPWRTEPERASPMPNTCSSIRRRWPCAGRRGLS